MRALITVGGSQDIVIVCWVEVAGSWDNCCDDAQETIIMNNILCTKGEMHKK